MVLMGLPCRGEPRHSTERTNMNPNDIPALPASQSYPVLAIAAPSKPTP